MNPHLPLDDLDPTSRAAIDDLLGRLGRPVAGVAEIWALLDLAWADCGGGHGFPDRELLSHFYRHPVWHLNGLFVEQDVESRSQREAICRWLARHLPPGGPQRLLDFGGGEAVLAAMLARHLPAAAVDIYEPFPSAAARRRIAKHPGVRFVDRPATGYDALVSTDVLEHLPDPLAGLAAMAGTLRPGGLALVTANFYPLIRCHLPQTFYLRYTLTLFAWTLGLDRLGRCHGSPAVVFRRRKRRLSWPALRRMETLARGLFPYLNRLHAGYRCWRRRPRRQPLA